MKKIIGILSLSLTIISGDNPKPSSKPIELETAQGQYKPLQDSLIPIEARQIAKNNGFQNWEQVSEIEFTFNVDRNQNHFARSWSWKPKTQDIQMISDGDTVYYNRLKMDSLSLKTDAAFINDKYWMLAPFQLMWDRGMEFSVFTNEVAPISRDTLGKLTIVYPDKGGYTPGDGYDFYYDENFKIKEWNYRKENSSKPSLTTTWEDYKNFKGIEIATMHKDKSGDFKLYFTDISIKTNAPN